MIYIIGKKNLCSPEMILCLTDKGIEENSSLVTVSYASLMVPEASISLRNNTALFIQSRFCFEHSRREDITHSFRL